MIFAFRVDASILIGSGHVMRCLALAEFLHNHGHRCLFICREHTGHLSRTIQERGFEVFLIETPDQPNDLPDISWCSHAHWLGVDWQKDADETFRLLEKQSVDWLIVDHYALDAQWERQISPVVGNIMVIDDLADRPHQCSILLDQNYGSTPQQYAGLVPNDCKCLIGPMYALLRPEFINLREWSLRRRSNGRIDRVLISFGGVDKDNFTGQMLASLAVDPLNYGIEFDVVMGASAQHIELVRTQSDELPLNISISQNVNDMADRMARADISIGAGGSTSWERCCMGLPTILLIMAENQKRAASSLEDVGAVIIANSCGDAARVLRGILENSAETKKVSEMVQANIELVAGDGCSRIFDELRNWTG